MGDFFDLGDFLLSLIKWETFWFGRLFHLIYNLGDFLIWETFPFNL